MNIALLIIDVQEAFIGHLKKTRVFEETMMYINETSKLFREAHCPVFVIRDISEGHGEAYENVQALQVEKTDIEILKLENNAFWQTDLEARLKDLQIDYLILCGNAAEFCVLATYNGARERGFGASYLQNGVFAQSSVGLTDIFENRSLVDYNMIEYILGQGK